MKQLILISGVLAAFLTAGVQAYANNDPAFTNSNPNIDASIASGPYDGSFSDSTFKSGSITFNNSQYTITGGTMSLTTEHVPNGDSVELTIGSGTGSTSIQYGNGSSPETFTFTLDTEQYDYIQSEDGSFSYTVTLDCTLDSDKLIVNTSQSTGTVPDGGSTVMLLGGALATLGLMKRKIA